jgi:hypothetical protein
LVFNRGCQKVGDKSGKLVRLAVDAMLPCLPKRHAGRDTLQATTIKMLISVKLSMTAVFIISQNKTH